MKKCSICKSDIPTNSSKRKKVRKLQNITAKIPDAMQLAVMYGSNMDQLKDDIESGDFDIKGALDDKPTQKSM